MMSKNTVIPEKYFVKNALINYYLVLMFAVFPLFFTAQYSNIRHDKFYLFLVLSIILILCELPLLIHSAVKNKSIGKLSFTDCTFAALIVIFTVSTVTSDYAFDSFVGESGRFCGLLTFVLFFFLYLVISRNFQYREYVFVIFAVVMLAVFALCILNSFEIDPLGMYNGYSEETRKDFVSTIGNKNIMSSLCCLCVPAFFMLFIHNKTGLRFFYLATSLIGFFAMIRCDSMSGYLGLFFVCVFLSLFYSFKSNKKLFWSLAVIYAIVVFAFAALFIYFTFFDLNTPLSGFMRFFRFDEKWGTHRGYMWIKSFEIFKGYNLKSILFGCGPDTFYNVFQPYFDELNSKFGDAVNNAAHNELLNYLITTGALGLAAYLSFIVSAVIRAVKAARKNILALVFIAPVVAYVFQSVANLSTIIVLPILFVFISLAENISQKELNAS